VLPHSNALGPCGAPVVLCGDTNSCANHPEEEMAWLAQQAQAPLVDCWKAAGDGSGGAGTTIATCYAQRLKKRKSTRRNKKRGRILGVGLAQLWPRTRKLLPCRGGGSNRLLFCWLPQGGRGTGPTP